MLSGSDETDLFDAVRAAASGYLLNNVTDEIADGIRGVFRRESQLSPHMATKVLAEFARMSQLPTA